jgi:hypothetical protein
VNRRLGYCFFVVGDLTDIKAKSTGVVWRDTASFSLVLLLLLLLSSLMTCNVCFLSRYSIDRGGGR